MPKLIAGATVLVATVLFAGAASIGAAQAPEGGKSAGNPVSASSAAPLDGCETANVIVDTVTPTLAQVSRVDAERESAGIGARGPASLATLARVTVGLRIGAPPSVAGVAPDLAGTPILSRPAWVLVFRDQVIGFPSNGVPARVGTPPTKRNNGHLTAVATIIDAETGRLIHGWGCAVAGRT